MGRSASLAHAGPHQLRQRTGRIVPPPGGEHHRADELEVVAPRRNGDQVGIGRQAVDLRRELHPRRDDLRDVQDGRGGGPGDGQIHQGRPERVGQQMRVVARRSHGRPIGDRLQRRPGGERTPQRGDQHRSTVTAAPSEPGEGTGRHRQLRRPVRRSSRDRVRPTG
jgi:hypothetical protein